MTFLYEELSLRPLLYMKIYHSWKACHFSCSRYHALAHKKPKNKTKQKMVGLKCQFNYSFQPIKITTLSMIFSVINIIVLAILFVNHNIVLPTLNVSPTLFIILCKKIGVANTITYQICFSSKFQSSHDNISIGTQ